MEQLKAVLERLPDGMAPLLIATGLWGLGAAATNDRTGFYRDARLGRLAGWGYVGLGALIWVLALVLP